MPIPPLQATPNLERLLVPNEEIIYTAKLHPLYGWSILLAALVLAILGWWMKPLWFVALIAAWVYHLPFQNFEMAVTTQRILIRQGRFKIGMAAYQGADLREWVVHQTLLQSVLHMGSVLLKLTDPASPEKNRTTHVLELNGIWHPLTLIEALETLQREDLK